MKQSSDDLWFEVTYKHPERTEQTVEVVLPLGAKAVVIPIVSNCPGAIDSIEIGRIERRNRA